MATLYISEYNTIGGNGTFPAQLAASPAIATQTVTISGVSAQSAPFNPKTNFIRMHNDAICSTLFGASPTATTAHPRSPADAVEYFAVNPGDRVAVITNT